MGFKYILLFTYLLITALLFINFEAAWEVWLSFFVSALIITGITLFHMFIERSYSPFLSAFIVFSFLFFLVAPIIQINSFEGTRPTFMTFFPYTESLTIYTNVLISLFNIIFFISYVYFKNHQSLQKVPKIKSSSERILPVTIIIIALICCVVFLSSFSYIIAEVKRPAWQLSLVSISNTLILKKVLFLLPLGGIILVFQYFKKDKKKASNLLISILALALFLILLIWFKNPLTEKRNALGPIYISLLFLFVPKLFNTNIKTLSFLFFSMIIVFPLSAILTHTDATFKEMVNDPSILIETMKGGGVTTTFNTLNYDAFTNIMATIDYVSVHGFSWGNQLLSAFLFFVPRSIWVDKPITTGQFIGDYLIEDYGFGFNNLSNPIVSEGFINFGIVGVILGAILLAYCIIKLRIWLLSDDYLKKIMAFYFAMHLIFLLRGDFANGFSYYIGTLVGVLVLPKLIEWILKQSLLKQKPHGKDKEY